MDTHIQNDATLNEVVEQYRAATEAIEFAQQQADQMVRQTISESGQRRFQLRLIDVAGIVRIERAETVLPVGDVLPQGAKVLEANSAAILLVEHADHQAHGFRIEGAPRAVRQGDLQLVGGYEAAVVFVDTIGRRPATRTMLFRRYQQFRTNNITKNTYRRKTSHRKSWLGIGDVKDIVLVFCTTNGRWNQTIKDKIGQKSGKPFAKYAYWSFYVCVISVICT